MSEASFEGSSKVHDASAADSDTEEIQDLNSQEWESANNKFATSMIVVGLTAVAFGFLYLIDMHRGPKDPWPQGEAGKEEYAAVKKLAWTTHA